MGSSGDLVSFKPTRGSAESVEKYDGLAAESLLQTHEGFG